MDKIMKGRCHCDQLNFEITAPTEFCSHCHCESCRRTHGSAFVTWTSVPDSQLKITKGKELLHYYESSPEIVWVSCGHCASPLFQITRRSPGRTYIVLASLIDPLDREPDSHVSFEEKIPWFKVNDGLPSFNEKSSDRLINGLKKSE